MELTDVLRSAGLSDKEAAVYLALLELGPSTAYRIGPKAKLKRPITYVVLEQLQRRGLTSVVPQGDRKLYVASEPGKLLGELEHSRELYKRFLPNFEALYQSTEGKEKPQVQLFEGDEGIRHVYDEILKAREVSFFATIRDFMEFYPEFADELIAGANAGRLRVREILSQNPADLAFAARVRGTANYEHRLAHAGSEFLTDNCLFSNKVTFFAYQPFRFAVVISSKAICQSITTLFELAWRAATPLGER